MDSSLKGGSSVVIVAGTHPSHFTKNTNYSLLKPFSESKPGKNFPNWPTKHWLKAMLYLYVDEAVSKSFVNVHCRRFPGPIAQVPEQKLLGKACEQNENRKNDIPPCYITLSSHNKHLTLLESVKICARTSHPNSPKVVFRRCRQTKKKFEYMYVSPCGVTHCGFVNLPDYCTTSAQRVER
jgi:hypothetical protein